MLFSIIIKNLKIIFRSPFTVLLLILAPMLLMIVLGITYNSTSVVNTKVGVFGNNLDLFKITSGIELIDYNNDGIERSKIDCINDLKRSQLNLCIEVQTTQKENQLESAQVTYYVDKTRTTYSDILVNLFNRKLDKVKEEISTQTVTDIVAEIDSSLKLIEDSRDEIEELEKSVLKIQSELNERKGEISRSLTQTKNIVNNLVESEEEITSSINFFSSNTFEVGVNSALNYNDEAITQLEIIDKSLDESIEILEEFGLFFEEIEEAKDALDETRDNIEESNRNLETIKDSFDSSKVENLNFQTRSLFNQLEILHPEVQTLDSDFDSFTQIVDNLAQDVTVAKSTLDEKYNYFKEISEQDTSKITQPIITSIWETKNNFQRIHQLAPTIIVLVLLFIGLLLSNVIVSLELNSKAYFRNLISPIKQSSFIWGLFFTSLIIVLFQIGFFLILLQGIFNIEIYINIVDKSLILGTLFNILVTIFHILAVFILLGIFLSYLFESMQVSIIVTTFVILFLFLLSNVILPLELMPQLAADLLLFNPVVIGEDLLRRLFFYRDFTFISVFDFIPFYLYSFILIILISIANYFRKKRLF